MKRSFWAAHYLIGEVLFYKKKKDVSNETGEAFSFELVQLLGCLKTLLQRERHFRD